MRESSLWGRRKGGVRMHVSRGERGKKRADHKEGDYGLAKTPPHLTRLEVSVHMLMTGWRK